MSVYEGNDNQAPFVSKKGAKNAGYFTREQWFKKYRAPYLREEGIEFRGEEYFRESQTEELYSKSKGFKEIGPLKAGSQSVGLKKFRTVRFQVYRESDFIPEERVTRVIPPARAVDLMDAISKVTETANKFLAAAKNSAVKNNHKRSRGFRSRARKLQEVAEIGLRRAIILELVTHVGKRGGVHRYRYEGREFRARVAPPQWYESNQNFLGESREEYKHGKSNVRLMDAIFTIEPFRDDATLDW